MMASATASPSNDGELHTAYIDYTAGYFRVYVDDTTTPVVVGSVELMDVLGPSHGFAWVGLTAASGGWPQAHIITLWKLESKAPFEMKATSTLPADSTALAQQHPTTKPAQLEISSDRPQGPAQFPPVTECEGVNNCTTWTFIRANGKMQGIANWETGEEAGQQAVLDIQYATDNQIKITRIDIKGPKQGRTTTYTGTLHGKQVGGEFTSEFNGQTHSGNWYWVFDDDSIPSLPVEMHYCAPGSDCISMHLLRDHYVWKNNRGRGVWTVRTWTRRKLSLERVDVSGFTGHYTGDIVNNHLENIMTSNRPFTPDWKPGPDTTYGNVLFAWGTELNTLPGDEGIVPLGTAAPMSNSTVRAVKPFHNGVEAFDTIRRGFLQRKDTQ